MAAFTGDKTNFVNGNADFSQYGFDGRRECIKKGTAYMNVFMYVIYELEDALDDCEQGCINCNADPVHAWDEGVCFYTGSTEGQDGTADGYLLHQLADKRYVCVLPFLECHNVLVSFVTLLTFIRNIIFSSNQLY